MDQTAVKIQILLCNKCLNLCINAVCIQTIFLDQFYSRTGLTKGIINTDLHNLCRCLCRKTVTDCASQTANNRMFLYRNNLACFFGCSNHQILIQRFNRMNINHLSKDAVCCQLPGSLQRLSNLKTCCNNSHVLTLTENNTLSHLKLVVRSVIDHRHSQTAKTDIYRTIMIQSSLYGSLCFHII